MCVNLEAAGSSIGEAVIRADRVSIVFVHKRDANEALALRTAALA